MERFSDNYYIEKVQSGDTGCYALLLERHSRQIFSLIVKVVGNCEDAEELTQDVFLKAYRSLSSFHGDSSFSTWLYRIAYNTAISATRKKTQEFSPVDEMMIENVPDELDETMFGETNNSEMLTYLNSALEKLDTDERAMIMLFYKDDKSMDEIANITGLSLTNVKTKIFRIRKKLFVLINSMKGK